MSDTETQGGPATGEAPASIHDLTDRQRAVLEVIERYTRERGYPPSVRDIGREVGLTSPSSVHSHLATLQRMGFLRRDATKPRALEVRVDPTSGATAARSQSRHVPLIGDVAAGTDVIANQNVEELVPVPADLCGEGDLFMLRVRGQSMVDAGILDGDLVVVRRQADAHDGEIVVAGIPGEEATVKTLRRRDGVVVLEPANPTMQPLVYAPDEVSLYGKVVTVLRKL